ncbi:MAG: AAA family ATPase [Myxococcota bacterium]
MLKKVVSVKNLGRLGHCVPRGDVEFLRLTALFAGNGTGKTTIAAMCRSLRDNDSTIMSARKTLGAPDAPSAQVQTDKGAHRFTAGAWSSPFPDIEILDQEFVHQNVHSGPVVEHDHRRQLYQFALGAEGVTLATEIDRLAGEIAEVQKGKRDLKGQIDAHTKGALDTDAFVGLPDSGDRTAELAKAKEDLKAIEQADRIRNAPLLRSLTELDVGADDLANLLGTSIGDVTADAEARARVHIARHADPRREGWLEHGTRFAGGDTCPYCDQDIRENALVAAMRAFFSAQYKELKERVASTASRIRRSLETYPGDVAAVMAANAGEQAFWREFLPGQAFPTADVEGMQQRAREVGARLNDVLARKQAAPLEDLSRDARFTEALALHANLVSGIRAYNDKIRVFNQAIEERKKQVTGASVEDGRKKVRLLELAILRQEPRLVDLCKKYTEANKRVGELEADKVKAREKLDAHAATVMPAYQKEINAVLERFGASFRIVRAKTNYQSGKPSAGYFIQIGKGEFDPSAKGTASPNLGNTLSEGDKRTLAFAFFVARLKKDPRLAEKILVFDDPMTSMDATRRHHTTVIIRDLANLARQVVVLSHDPTFLFQLLERSRDIEHREVQLVEDGDKVFLDPWDAAEDTLSDYLKDFRSLSAFASGGAAHDLRAMAQRLRILLEGSLRFRFPDDFRRGEWLGDFVGNAKKAPAGSVLADLADLGDIEDVKDYCSRYHHSNPNAAAEPIDVAELRAYAKRTLKLVQR